MTVMLDQLAAYLSSAATLIVSHHSDLCLAYTVFLLSIHIDLSKGNWLIDSGGSNDPQCYLPFV